MDVSHPKNWKYSSPESEGFHEVITPENSACDKTYVYRLNLPALQKYTLLDKHLELNAVVISGNIHIAQGDNQYSLGPMDSFYLPSGNSVIIEAREDSVLFIGGCMDDGNGTFFTRTYDLSLPLGNIHQVHGEPPYQRTVFMTLAQEDEAARLICGITIGDPGKWTSWPPHQHTKDLEEVYCYFDIPKPKSAFHFCSRKSGVFEFVHPVSTGDFVIIPEGYHPTSAMPGVKSCYFWIMVAHQPESRRYDLAVNDPLFN